MRIPKPFGIRSTSDNNELTPKIRYFLAFEGDQTEFQYFSGITRFRKELGINVLFTVIPLQRNHAEASWSHPCKFITPLIASLKESSNGQMSIESIVKHSIDCIIYEFKFITPQQEKDYLLGEKLYAKLSKLGYTKESYVEDQAIIIGYVCECLYSIFPDQYTEKSIEILQNYISEQEYCYNSKVDKVCIIIDRDPQNFKTHQYNKLVEVCNNRNFSLHVSNPCFELWLLMHYPIILELDINKMHENIKVTRNTRFLEKEVKKQFPEYRKNNLPFEKLVNKVDTAIFNAQYFCENLEKLESNLGSNVGLLLKELKSDK